MSDNYQAEADRFAGDITEHVLTVLHDEGVYRHLLFKRPGSSMYWFEILTTPGQLTIRGDMGCYVFARINDMFEFFQGNINPMYWGEKLQAIDRSGGYERFSERRFNQFVAEDWAERKDDYSAEDQAAIWDEIEEQLIGLDTSDNAYRALTDFDERGYRYTDAWDHDFKDYTVHFLWCCYAILWGIKQYRAAKS